MPTVLRIPRFPHFASAERRQPDTAKIRPSLWQIVADGLRRRRECEAEDIVARYNSDRWSDAIERDIDLYTRR